MKKVDKINLTLGLGGFALGIWAIIMSYKAINSSESIADINKSTLVATKV